MTERPLVTLIHVERAACRRIVEAPTDAGLNAPLAAIGVDLERRLEVYGPKMGKMLRRLREVSMLSSGIAAVVGPATFLVAAAALAAMQDPERRANQEPASGDGTVDIRGIWKDNGVDRKKAAARGLDAKEIKTPQKIRTANPEYPAAAMKARVTGRVVLECRIDIDGVTRDCKVARSATPALDAAAMKAVVQWMYAPLTLRGEPRSALVELTVTFNLD